MTRRRRLTRADRRSQILQAAARLFAEKGYSGTKTKDLAAACGVNESIIYQHFNSKDDLFKTVLEEKIAAYDLDAFLKEIPVDLSLEETMKRIALKILEIGLDEPTIHKLLLAATFRGSAQTQQVYVSWRIPFVAYLERRIREGINEGEIRDVDPVITSRAFIGLVMDCVLNCDVWAEIGRRRHPPEQLVGNNVPIFVRGLLREPAAGSKAESDLHQRSRPVA